MENQELAKFQIPEGYTAKIEGNDGDYFIVNLDEVELVRKFNKKK